MPDKNSVGDLPIQQLGSHASSLSNSSTYDGALAVFPLRFLWAGWCQKSAIKIKRNL